jgi:two-component system, response regulator YesN
MVQDGVGSMKIMVIDDELFARKDLRNLMEELDPELEVCDFETPLPALEYLEETHIDFIISDIRMPDMDGLEFFEIVNRQYPWIYQIIVSGFDNFEYAQKAIKFGVKAFILKPVEQLLFNDELTKAFSSVNKKASDKIREKIIAGKEQILKRETIETWLYYFLYGGSDKSVQPEVEAEIMWTRGIHCLSIVKTDVKLTSEMLEKTRKSIDALLTKAKCFMVTGRNRGEFILLFYCEDCYLQQSNPYNLRVIKLMNSLMLDGRSSFNSNYYIAVSKTRSGRKGLEESFAQAEAIMETRFYFKSNMAIDFKKIEMFSLNENTFTNQKMVLLEDLLIKGYWKAVADEIDEIFQDIRDMSIKSVYDILSICRHCYNVLIKVLWRNDYILDQDSKKIIKKLSQISNYFDADHLKEDLCHLLNKVAEADSVKIHKDDMVCDLVNFLSKNYDLDISFSELAERRYNVSAEHLNRKFKRQSGKNLSVYLMEVRIDKARELLSDFSLNITDIAGIVGYNDISHFIQTFKKRFGDTPGEFRKKVSLERGCLEHETR